MKVGSVHRKEKERGEAQQSRGGHCVEVRGVGERKVPQDYQRHPQDWDEELREIKVLRIFLQANEVYEYDKYIHNMFVLYCIDHS